MKKRNLKQVPDDVFSRFLSAVQSTTIVSFALMDDTHDETLHRITEL